MYLWGHLQALLSVCLNQRSSERETNMRVSCSCCALCLSSCPRYHFKVSISRLSLSTLHVLLFFSSCGVSLSVSGNVCQTWQDKWNENDDNPTEETRPKWEEIKQERRHVQKQGDQEEDSGIPGYYHRFIKRDHRTKGSLSSLWWSLSLSWRVER
jgi:hypothetical protein